MRLDILLLIPVLMIAAMVPRFAMAGEADVVAVDVRATGTNTFSFDVSVLHADAGWDHYANKWDVMSPDRTTLGTRVLAHPHDGEQPFTRSLSGVRISKGVKSVIVRAHDSVHKYGGGEMTVKLPGR